MLIIKAMNTYEIINNSKNMVFSKDNKVKI